MCSLVSWNTELPNRKINNRGGGWNFKVVNANECDAFFALLFFLSWCIVLGIHYYYICSFFFFLSFLGLKAFAMGVA